MKWREKWKKKRVEAGVVQVPQRVLLMTAVQAVGNYVIV